MKNRFFYFYLSIFLILLFLAIFASVISPFEPNFQDFSNSNIKPNAKYFFGTDIFGRDIFSRVLYGLKTSLFIGILAGFLSTFFAFFYAYLASINRKFNLVLERLIDGFLSIPNILFIMLFSSFGDGNTFYIVLIIASFSWMQSSKVFIQNLEISLKSDYAMQAKILGANHFELIFFEILPNLKNLFVTLFGINFVSAVSSEATLSFFGIGSNLNQISLGIILQESIQALFMGYWWNFLLPCFMLFLLIICVMLLTGSFEKKGIKI